MFNHKNQAGSSTVGGLIILALWIAAVGGWIANIVKLVHAASGNDVQITVMILLRIMGIIATPLGAILGYL